MNNTPGNQNGRPRIISRETNLSVPEFYAQFFGNPSQPSAESNQASQSPARPAGVFPPIDSARLQQLLALQEQQRLQEQLRRNAAGHGNIAPQVRVGIPEVNATGEQKGSRPRLKKIGKWTLSAALVAGVSVAAYTVYDQDVYGVQGSINQLLQPEATQSDDEFMDAQIKEAQDLGIQGFDPKSCDKPEAVFQVATIERAELPLVPLVNSTKDKILKNVAPFLTTESISAGVPKEQVEEAHEGYPVAVFEDLKLGISACADNADAIVKLGNGSYEVNMYALTVKFKDLGLLYPDVGFIAAKYNPDPTKRLAADPDKGEYLSYDNPTYFIKRGVDEVQDKTLDALSEAMITESQMKFLYAMGEKSLVASLIDISSDNFEKKEFPGGANSLQKVIQNAIIARLGVSEDAVTFKGTDFNYKSIVPIASDTMKPITEPDKDGKVRLINLDPTQKLVNIEMNIQNGSLSRPIKPSPEETPLPTPSPTTNQ